MKIIFAAVCVLSLCQSLCLAADEPPPLDPKRIINESYGFLKEREPNLTAEEQAIYNKVLPMLSTQPDFAIKLLEVMVNENSSPAFEFILGNTYYSLDKKEKAEELYRRAIKRYPTFLRAWNNCGVICYSQERFPEAIECLTKVISLGDRESSTYGLLGYCLERTHDPISAEIAYTQAIMTDPFDIGWKEGLMRVCMFQKQYPRAEAIARRLLKEHPAEPKYWLTYASILLYQEQRVRALVVLDEAKSLGVASQEAIETLADLYAEQKLAPESIALYQGLLAKSHNLGERRMIRLGQVLIADGKYTQAEAVLNAIQSSISHDTRISFYQASAELYSAQKRYPEARAQLTELLKLEPLNGSALMGLGKAYLAEEDTIRAAQAFEAASQSSGNVYSASIELANIELKNKQFEKSASHIEKALTIERTPVLEEYLAQLRVFIARNNSPSS